MSKLNKKVCKYPKCHKEIPGEKGVFCSHHKKLVKETSKTIGKGTAAVLGTAGALLFTNKIKKD
ncbi:hypothetical protein [Vagococcus lutrae]|uniref:hypothetical protein n=1 Tax=Vagococcus lutrae TaxID=81947 RepID=UPI00200C85E8|nr:hypothetical protein [Vagococcus lutrae]MDT2805935.1 hypothetical protein [Vagococcus lutrae]UQF18489.1 hypothetical protein M2905_07545 [Vagococcus lutrae]